MESSLHLPMIDGALPFVGRAEERRRLAAFWERTRDADGAYLGLLTGEAGIGKSRLLQEVLPEIENAGGAVAHAKLYPHASARIMELIGAAVTVAGARNHLPARPAADATTGAAAVVSQVRRLCRLRRTLLVLEDVHLLGTEELSELDSLIRSLADDPIGVLCVARSIEMKGLGALEEKLVETIHLGGLDRSGLADLWTRLFDADPDEETIAGLHEATRGNGLAIRSALRAAIESGALTYGERGRVVAGPMFAAVARQKAGRIAGGLMLHLSAEDREAAYALAQLGEIFSREAALEMVPGAAPILARLVDGQIVTTLGQPALPLPGTPDPTRPYDARCDVRFPASAYPLMSFTHSLLHRELLEEGAPSWGRLARTLALDLPVYSLVPLESLVTMSRDPGVDPGDLQRVVGRACEVAQRLNDGSTWRSGLAIADAAAEVVRTRAELWPDRRDEMEADALFAQISLRRRSFTTEEYRTLADRLDVLTCDPRSSVMASYRFGLYACRSWEARSAEANREMRIDGEAMLARFPELAYRREYLVYLKSVTADATVIGPGRARELELLLDEFTSRPGVKEGYRQDIYRLRSWFLNYYADNEELALRMRQLEELDRESGGEDEAIGVARCKLLGYNGWMELTDDAVEAMIRRLTRRGVTGYPILNFRTMQVISRTGFEPDRARLEEEVARLREEFEGLEDKTRLLVVMTLMAIGLLRGDAEWMTGEVLAGAEQHIVGPMQTVQLHALLLDGEGLRRDFEMFPDVIPSCTRDLLGSMIAALDGRPDLEMLVRSMTALVDREIMKVSDLVYLHALFAFTDRCRTEKVDPAVLRAVGNLPQRALEAWLSWLAERSLFALVRLLIGRYGGYLDVPRVDVWRARADVLEREWRERRAKLTEGPIELSMFDTVTLRRPGEEAEPLRGARMRIMIGLMVADRMIRTPLSHADFCGLIAGDDATVEHPRKVMNLGVFRLRELLGGDAILTDAETPRLNLERVRVDLLDADALVRRGAHHLREGNLARALPDIAGALELVGGRTPFPSLYDRFFEAMREDFESRLRSAVIGAAELALGEEDAVGAERVLRLAAVTLPGDEEVVELLGRALVALDRRAEAELLARRAT